MRMADNEYHIVCPADQFFDDPDGKRRSAVIAFLKARGMKHLSEQDYAICMWGTASAANRVRELLRQFHHTGD